jgi:ABC-type multidrug transport system fused ATPase/permease subunit
VTGDFVVRLALLGFVAAFVKGVGGVGAGFFQARLSGAVGDALRLEALQRRTYLVAHPRQNDQGAQVGVASTTFLAVDDLTTGVREVQAGVSALFGVAKAVLQLVPLVLLAVWSGTRFLLIAGLVLLPFGIMLSRAKKHVKTVQRRTLDESALLLEATDEAIRHAELWSSYRAAHRVRERVADASRRLTRRMANAVALTAGLSGATEALGALALLLVVVGVHVGAPHASSMDGGRVLAFAVAFFMAYKPLRELVEARLAWVRAGTAAERLKLDEAPQPSIDVWCSRRPASGGSVDVWCSRRPASGGSVDVWCSRRPASGGSVDDERGDEAHTPVVLELRGVELERGKLGVIDARIEPGTIVVIRGATGVGKTTLFRTLLGFARLRAGEIRGGGGFAWVPQDAPIVRGTLAENVALGGSGDVRAAMDAIGAGDLFQRLRDVQLGVGGRALSGGEQKQVAIARALATRQPILLLDEPTSGLDDGAQAAVLSAIARLRGKRTVLIVTHRPEPVAIADEVLLFGSAKADREARALDPHAP